MRVAIIGGTAGLGRALAEEAGRRGHELLLVSSDRRDLSAMAAHLNLVYSVRVDTLPWHFAPGSGPIDEFVKNIPSPDSLDAILFPIGGARMDDTAELPESGARALMETNFLGVATTISALMPYFLSRNSGWIVGFGSIASVRGRSRNVFYAAAKRALIGYFESLQHALAGTGVRAQFYVLGYLDTPRIAGDKFLLPKRAPARAANVIFSNLDCDVKIIYYPWFWKPIAAILRMLPWVIFSRVKV